MDLVYIFIISFGMDGKRLHIVYLLLILLISGCNNTRYYVVGSTPDYEIKKLPEKDVSLVVKDYGYGKVIDYRIYTTEKSFQGNINFEDLLPYVKAIYKHTQPKRYYEFLNEVQMEIYNDSILVFRFSQPIIIHGYNSYVYHIKEGVFTFTSGNTGKY